MSLRSSLKRARKQTKIKKNLLYSLRERGSGAMELVVYRMVWEYEPLP
jgi:hypothetical protein